MKTLIQKFLWSILPTGLYNLLWAFYASVCNCRTMLFRMGMFRSMQAGGSVDAQGNPMPWYTYPAIDYIKGRDLSKMDVFEFGSGYGTAYFSRHAKSVTSVEHQAEWRDKVLEMAPEANVILATTKAKYVKAISAKPNYDIIVVDGEWRLACAKVVAKKLRRGGMIIVDNADVNADVVAIFDNKGMLRVDFHGFSPYINYRQDTAIFFDKRIS